MNPMAKAACTANKPILFRPELVRAILDGRKWQTRRLPKSGKLPLPECAPYRVGDVLYVRERWMILDDGIQKPGILYAADDWTMGGPWKSSLHLKKKDSRLWLLVTKVRAERIQKITEMDASAEGFRLLDGMSARKQFRLKWDEINERRGGGWDDNPWVWVYDFDKIWPIPSSPKES